MSKTVSLRLWTTNSGPNVYVTFNFVYGNCVYQKTTAEVLLFKFGHYKHWTLSIKWVRNKKFTLSFGEIWAPRSLNSLKSIFYLVRFYPKTLLKVLCIRVPNSDVSNRYQFQWSNWFLMLAVDALYDLKHNYWISLNNSVMTHCNLATSVNYGLSLSPLWPLGPPVPSSSAMHSTNIY